MSDIKWEDPPITGSGRSNLAGYGRHAAIAAELKAHPGEWAKVLTGVNAHAGAQIRRAAFSAYQPAGSFEAVSRNTRKVDGRVRCDIYARYIGEEVTE